MDVARRALEGGIELGGELRFAAVLFVDIIGSTELATKTAAERVVEALNAFFAVVVEVTEAHGGWVNKFQGDAALCVFGLPAGDERCAAHALAAARTLALRRPPARAPGAHSAGAACVAWSRGMGRVVFTVLLVGGLTVPSAALGRSAQVRLLTPVGGTRSARRRWPVLYLLHGCCDSYQSWTQSTDIERLPALRDVLVVMPEGGDIGFYSNWRDGPRWQDFHLRELPRILDGYGAGSRRAIAGLSMGGLGAIDYAAQRPRVFRAAASFSGVLHPLGAPRYWLGLFSSYTSDPRAVWGDPKDDATSGAATTRRRCSPRSRASRSRRTSMAHPTRERRATLTWR